MKNIIFLTIVAVFLIGLLEGGLRVMEARAASVYQEDAILGWRFKPYAVVEISKGLESVNSLGWRGSERDYFSKGRKKRIVCLGDSCTFGVLLAHDEQTYPRQLENILKQKYQEDVEVFNFGVNGFSTLQGGALMRGIVSKVHPDIAIIYFGWNDMARIVGWFDYDQKIRWINSFWHHFATFRTFIRLTDGLFQNLRYSRRIGSIFDTCFLKNALTPEQVEVNLKSMVQSAHRNGIQLIFVTTPYGQQGREAASLRYARADKKARRDLTATSAYYAYQITKYNEILKKIANESKTSVIDLASVFDSFPPDKLESCFHPGDAAHPNEKGCQLIATLMADFIDDGWRQQRLQQHEKLTT
ncbi:MAG: SGNH/GDSL hydrolase family protein [Patescibacteria group bacterium]|jgi:lysophospholipase L1-like esterase